MKDPQRLPSDHSRIVQAYVADNLMQAHLIKGFLDSEGIFSLVRGEHLVALHGEIPISMDTMPSIWVDADDRKRARELIGQALSGQAIAKDWMCGKCRERVESQFTECWRCGAGRESF